MKKPARQQRIFAKKLQGPIRSRPSTHEEEITNLKNLVQTLTKQRDDALKHLNDAANIQQYVIRYNTAVKQIEEIAVAIVRVGQFLLLQRPKAPVALPED